jgi:hypothetical protein
MPIELIGGAVGAVVASVLLLGGIAACLLWRLKRAKKSRIDDIALQPDGRYMAHAADYKIEEGPRYDSLSTDEAGTTLPVDELDRGYEAAAPATSLRKSKAKANPSDPAPLKTKSKDAQSNPSHLPGLSQRSSKVGGEFSSARAEAWVIDASDLELGSVIGQGAFGVVRRAEWRGRTVAVKQIKKSTIGDDKAVADFEEEIGRMAALPMHENVVRLFGVVELANGDIGAVVEFCAQGALVDALYGEKARDFSPDELLQIAYDAACGVMHLHECKIVHRDIAARNVLLAGKKDLVAKVSDFGMARNLESVYSGVASEQHTAATIGPVKWMAPEQLERMAYSRASDVFAFGVLLYEIFALDAVAGTCECQCDCAGDHRQAHGTAENSSGRTAQGDDALLGARAEPATENASCRRRAARSASNRASNRILNWVVNFHQLSSFDARSRDVQSHNLTPAKSGLAREQTSQKNSVSALKNVQPPSAAAQTHLPRGGARRPDQDSSQTAHAGSSAELT